MEKTINKESKKEIIEDLEKNESLKKEKDMFSSKKNKEMMKELEEKIKELEEEKIRDKADFENYKKRLEKEKGQAIEFSNEKFAKDLLSPLDNLKIAKQSTKLDNDPKKLIKDLEEGMNLIEKSFNNVFQKNKIEEVSYDEFNPDYHNCVAKVDSKEHKSGEIVEVMQAGYLYNGRLLREAMVSIAN